MSQEVQQGTDQTQGQEQGSDKEQKKYNANIAKLTAVMRGKENLFPTKRVDNSAIGDLAQELLKERKEALSKEVKAGLSEILDKRVQLEKEIKAKEEELKKLSAQKMKEFNEAVGKWFQKIEDIDQLEKDYQAVLTPKGA